MALKLPLRTDGRGGGLHHAGFVFTFVNDSSNARDVFVKGHEERANAPKNLFGRLQAKFEERFERFRDSYRDLLGSIMLHRRLFVTAFLAFCLLSGGLAFFLGRDFFPTVDAGQFRLHVRGRAGLRIEETARLVDQVSGNPPERSQKGYFYCSRQHWFALQRHQSFVQQRWNHWYL
jgi:hypothetical protein